MKKLAITLCLAITFAVPVMVQAQTIWTTSKIEAYNGYDYELWNQDNKGNVQMKLTGDNGSGANAVGGTFEATWSSTINVLFRSGKKWGSNSTQNHTQIGNMSINFDATWSSTDNVKMLGVYGWAYFTQANVPTKQENGTASTFSNQIEYYIIQDRGSYNSAAQGTNSKKYGSATIDGILYDFYVCDRIDQAMLTGKGNFKQFFSVPQSTSSHRTKGTISVSEHFKAWEKVGMKMDGPLYEVAMKVESYTGQAQNSNGSAKVTKNILTIGTATPASSSSVAASSSSRASSSSVAASSSSRASSSSAGGAQVCGEYQTSFCGGLAYGSVPSNSTTMPGTGSCLYIGDFEIIQPALSSTVAINGVENTCGSDWDNCTYNTKPAAKDGGYYVYVKTGTINSYENNGWQGIVAKAKPTCTTQILNSKFPIPNSQLTTYYSLKGEPLGNAKPQKAGVYIVKEGYSVQKIVVR